MKTFHAFVLFSIFKSLRAAEICCPDIGCFTDDPPYDSWPLPECPGTMVPRMDYTMYTRADATNGEVFDHTTVPSIFNPALRTIFEVHGWNGDSNNNWMHDMKDAILAAEDMNVVIVGWGGGSDNPLYLQSASNTRTAGAQTALVFANLVSSGGGSDTRMWCTGHSLGAHHCGHAGMKTTLERVTGMDPAGPAFEGNPDKTIGLNPTSARFVDVIHTDGGQLGTVRDLGHIDFFPGGGQEQPSCTGFGESSCSHGMVLTYFRLSAGNNCYLSRETCTDYANVPGSCTACTTCGGSHCAEMGFHADKSCMKTGLHYVEVTANSPYCVG